LREEQYADASNPLRPLCGGGERRREEGAAYGSEERSSVHPDAPSLAARCAEVVHV